MASNRYGVPQKQWRKWTDGGRALFNELYSSMRDQRIYLMLDAGPISFKDWKVTRWTAAFIAACAVTRRDKAAARRAAQPQRNR
jgi:hypothetical protein